MKLLLIQVPIFVFFIPKLVSFGEIWPFEGGNRIKKAKMKFIKDFKMEQKTQNVIGLIKRYGNF